jgi:hypothetical protein
MIRILFFNAIFIFLGQTGHCQTQAKTNSQHTGKQKIQYQKSSSLSEQKIQQQESSSLSEQKIQQQEPSSLSEQSIQPQETSPPSQQNIQLMDPADPSAQRIQPKSPPPPPKKQPETKNRSLAFTYGKADIVLRSPDSGFAMKNNQLIGIAMSAPLTLFFDSLEVPLFYNTARLVHASSDVTSKYRFVAPSGLVYTGTDLPMRKASWGLDISK